MNIKYDNNYKYFLDKAFYNVEGIALALLLFFTPIAGILLTMLAFIVLDTITGIWKARKLKTPITSRGLSAVISKILLYEGAILVTFLIGQFILGDILFRIFGIQYMLTKTVAFLFIMIEVKSIDENYKIIKGIDIWSQFKSLLSRVKEVKDDINKVKEDTEEIKKAIEKDQEND